MRTWVAGRGLFGHSSSLCTNKYLCVYPWALPFTIGMLSINIINNARLVKTDTSWRVT